MMANVIDRQGILDNLTSIETTAKLLLNAFVKKTNDAQLVLDEVHREELINQTAEFLSQSRTTILSLSKALNIPADELFQKKILSNEG
jgi:hypothetical protein